MKRKQFNSKFKIDNSQKGKYKRTFNGILFDSEMELKFYRDVLIPLQQKGEIKDIILQPKFPLVDGFTKQGKKVLPINYISDFKVLYVDGRIIVYDVKGLPTESAKIKRKLFDNRYRDLRLEWVTLSAQDGGWIKFEDLLKARAKRKKEKNSD
jgi:hypothetical protein